MAEYEIIKSARRSVAIEVKEDLSVVVRAPYFLSDSKISEYVLQKQEWIEKTKKNILSRGKMPEITKEQEILLKKQAQEILPQKVLAYSKLMNLYPTAVKITSAKKRFGSCNGKNSICFSYMLMLYPDSAIDYVVVHELAHIKYKNHKRDFYALIEKYLPDYKQREMLLKKYADSK